MIALADQRFAARRAFRTGGFFHPAAEDVLAASRWAMLGFKQTANGDYIVPDSAVIEKGPISGMTRMLFGVVEQLCARFYVRNTPPRWLTLEQAWVVKYTGGWLDAGAIAYSTVNASPALQPKGGIPDAWISNRKVWRPETIDEWCDVTDESLDAYLLKYNPDRAIPKRIKQKLERRKAAIPLRRVGGGRR